MMIYLLNCNWVDNRCQ